VIRSLNSDKPYDQFVTEQFAGDEIRDGGSEAIIATGYYRLGIWDDEPSDPEQARYDGLDDILATTGQVFLGLTLDCARCHNHKFDPIPQQDYYRLLAFFQNINPYRNGGATDEALLFRDPTAKRVYEERLRALEQKRSETQVEIRAIEDEFRALYGAHAAEAAQPEKRARELARLLNETGASVLGSERFERYRALVRTLGELTKERPPAEAALCVTEAGPRAPESFVLARGNAHAPAEKVEPGFPAVFHAPPPALATPAPDAMTSGRRTVLARWIASRDNPMTARVMVNRLWQHHFGRGIVRSPNNFGTGGDKPTHPELLDWLASEFLANGWRLKPMHRMVLLSQAYRMSSRSDAAAVAADPSNDLFWRFDMRRLTAEEIRDSILSLTGTLNPRMYVEIPAQVMQGQSQPGKGWGRSPPDEQARRSIYIHVKRSLLTPILQSFDLAETDRSTPTRFVSTQPTQALGMLNGDFLNQQAAALAARLTQEAPGDTTAQARRALALATGRRPADAAVRHAVELIDSLQRREGATPELALECFCLMVLNLNEFLYLD
jgi:hypothetical protein